MNFEDVIAVVATGITLGSILVSWVLFAQARRAEFIHEISTARAMLAGVLAGLSVWGDLYFGEPYTRGRIVSHANADRAAVQDGSWAYKFAVPTSPVAALVSGAAENSWVSEGTVSAAGLALWQMGLFNDLVREQNDLGRQHRVELADPEISAARRAQIADAVMGQSTTLHRAIGTGRWYHQLKLAVARNIQDLDRRMFWANNHAIFWREPPKPGSQMPEAPDDSLAKIEAKARRALHEIDALAARESV